MDMLSLLLHCNDPIFHFSLFHLPPSPPLPLPFYCFFSFLSPCADARRRLLDAAKGLADATAKMVEAAKAAARGNVYL